MVWRPVARVRRSLRRAEPVVAFLRDYLVVRQAGDLAAGVAFHALLYLFPFLGSVLALTGFLFRDDRRQAVATDAILALFPDRDWRQEVADLVNVSAESRLLGLVSLIGLFWLGSSFIASLARAFDALYGAPARHALRQRLIALVVIAVAASALLLVVVASSQAVLLLARSSALVPLVGAVPSWGRRLALGLIGLAAAFVTAWLFFLALYWLLPNVHQPIREVWRGAALAAALMIAINQLFPLYIRFAPVDRYGALFGLVVLFTIWLYLLAHVTLLGAALNAFTHRPYRR